MPLLLRPASLARLGLPLARRPRVAAAVLRIRLERCVRIHADDLRAMRVQELR